MKLWVVWLGKQRRWKLGKLLVSTLQRAFMGKEGSAWPGVVDVGKETMKAQTGFTFSFSSIWRSSVLKAELKRTVFMDYPYFTPESTLMTLYFS